MSSSYNCPLYILTLNQSIEQRKLINQCRLTLIDIKQLNLEKERVAEIIDNQIQLIDKCNKKHESVIQTLIHCGRCYKKESKDNV